MSQKPDTQPGAYYVSVMRGNDYRLLAGPFENDHAGALARVDEARNLACDYDPKACFYAFGTCRMEPGFSQPGIFNAQMGLI